MALMFECRAIIPGDKGKKEKHCSERNPSGNKTCRSCGRSLKRGGGVYWIDWRDHGKRRRERIGPSKEAAELRLGEIRRAIVEERHINRDKGARMSLGELAQMINGERWLKNGIQADLSIIKYVGKDDNGDTVFIYPNGIKVHKKYWVKNASSDTSNQIFMVDEINNNKKTI